MSKYIIFSLCELCNAKKKLKRFMSWGEGVDSRQINEEKDQAEERKDEKG